MQNEIETQLKKIQKEKMKLKNIKSKLAKEKFEKVYLIIKNNFETLPDNLKSELRIYFENDKENTKKTIKKNTKTNKNIDNI